MTTTRPATRKPATKAATRKPVSTGDRQLDRAIAALSPAAAAQLNAQLARAAAKPSPKAQAAAKPTTISAAHQLRLDAIAEILETKAQETRELEEENSAILAALSDTNAKLLGVRNGKRALLALGNCSSMPRREEII